MKSKIIIKQSDIHHHLRARMQQRGVSKDEIEITINEGRIARDAKEGTIGKVYVFPNNAEWEGKYFEEKEVTVYYKHKDKKLILLTAKARYGRNFSKGGESK
ncbi:MAG: DUF4258 domain-containing protein [Nitrospirae bacterium]|nr:DUF4258 domain-containing protein [Nitrospirota bacterium]